MRLIKRIIPHSHLNSVQQIKSYQPDLCKSRQQQNVEKINFSTPEWTITAAIKQLVHQIQAEILKFDI